MSRKAVTLLLATAAVALTTTPALALDFCDCEGRKAQCRASRRPWHGNYYHVTYRQPMALIVPPTAEYVSNYSWGPSGTTVSRIDHQFQRPYPGEFYGGGSMMMPPPVWPSSTRQFGVYPVRGPW